MFFFLCLSIYLIYCCFSLLIFSYFLLSLSLSACWTFIHMYIHTYYSEILIDFLPYFLSLQFPLFDSQVVKKDMHNILYILSCAFAFAQRLTPKVPETWSLDFHFFTEIFTFYHFISFLLLLYIYTKSTSCFSPLETVENIHLKWEI